MPRHSGRKGRAPLVMLAALAAGVLLLRRMFPVRVVGLSMVPTLEPGDLVACSAVRGRVRPGSIVVVRGAMSVIKRVASVEGDRAFVIGDNPDSSTDSRTTGPVEVDQIVGVARGIYWPPRRWRLLR